MMQYSFFFSQIYILSGGPSSSVDWLREGRSGDRIPVGTRFSAPVQTDPGAHPASCKMVTGSFPGVKSSRGVTLTLHPLLVPWSRKSTAIPLLPLWAVRPVQSLSACTRVHFFIFHLPDRRVTNLCNWRSLICMTVAINTSTYCASNICAFFTSL